VSAYVKIAIKVAIVLVICLIIIVAYNVVLHRAKAASIAKMRTDLAAQTVIATALDSLLQYKDILPQIRQVQLQDMQTIRNLVPDSREFALTSYLRVIHAKLADNHLETNGIAIGGTRAPTGGTDFKEAFSSDITALSTDLVKITDALQMFKDRMNEMDDMLVSFQFYTQVSTGAENFQAIAGGIEQHAFTMTVRGTYQDIKKFTFDIFNMRPITALTSFTMGPQGAGFGATRQYAATFRLVTYGDANNPPPLWLAYNPISNGPQSEEEQSAEAGGAAEQTTETAGQAEQPSDAEAAPGEEEKPGAGEQTGTAGATTDSGSNSDQVQTNEEATR
jgi:hypothetical protein